MGQNKKIKLCTEASKTSNPFLKKIILTKPTLKQSKRLKLKDQTIKKRKILKMETRLKATLFPIYRHELPVRNKYVSKFEPARSGIQTVWITLNLLYYNC